MRKLAAITVVGIITALLFASCSSGPKNPLDEIRNALKGVPTYSVILEDMRETGNIFTTYQHKYTIVMEDQKTQTDWADVSKKVYDRYGPFLGMTILSKQDGKEGGSAGPPGYEYVGNPKYGSWQSHASGGSFWVFYGQYRLLSDLLGGRSIFRRDYDRYEESRGRGTPYYGPNKEYGTNGSWTRQKKPNFYSRQMSRQLNKKSTFSNKVQNRIGRTRTPVRSRGVRVGK